MRVAITPTRMSAVIGSVIVLLVAGGIVLAASNHHTTPPVTKVVKTIATGTKTPTKKTNTQVTTNQPTNLTTNNTSAADQQTNAAASAQPITNACSLLTLSTAKQLIGPSAASSTPSDTSSLQVSGTSVSSCAYTGNGSVQLVIRKPINSVGTSENDVAFGSAKPSDAVTVQGYGQSAYWDPGKATLNVLGSNNWYIISRTTNAQADAEATANLLKTGF
jgi:hypothetical protein